jgi:hypothetical protein
MTSLALPCLNLVEVASSDDEESNDPGAATNRFFASVVRFNAAAGTEFQIALDGFNGAGGSYLLSGPFIQTPDLLPRRPGDESGTDQVGELIGIYFLYSKISPG